MSLFISLLVSAITIGSVFLFGCTGEILMEKSGHLNLGIPGVMCFGTFGGCLGASIFMSGYSTDSMSAPWIGVVFMSVFFSVLMSLIAGLIYALLTVTFRCNQNVTGLALATFGTGCADYFMSIIDKTYLSYASKILRLNIFDDVILKSNPALSENAGIDFLQIFLGYGIIIYLAIIIAIVVAVVLRKTRIGLSLRAVGENPATADAVGINVTKYKYAAILCGSAISGLGGLSYVMDFVGGSWENSSTIQAFGWLAIALVIFCVWKPTLAIIGSLVFGFLFILPNAITGVTFLMMKTMNLIPYVITVIVLIITSIIGKRSVQPPSSLGLPYFREER